jgi:hypothetical protein
MEEKRQERALEEAFQVNRNTLRNNNIEEYTGSFLPSSILHFTHSRFLSSFILRSLLSLRLPITRVGGFASYWLHSRQETAALRRNMGESGSGIFLCTYYFSKQAFCVMQFN